MSTDAKPADPAPTEPKPTVPDGKDGGCQPCELESIDGLTCRAKKYEKQAEIMKQVATDLATYKTQYGTHGRPSRRLGSPPPPSARRSNGSSTRSTSCLSAD